MTSIRPLELPELQGRHTRLREWRVADIAVVMEASHDPLIPLVTTIPRSAGEAEALAYVERQHDRLRSGAGYAFAIADSAGDAVGYIGLMFAEASRARLGYWTAPSRRRRGYAADALCTLTAWASRCVAVDGLDLYIAADNLGSVRVAESAGYRFVDRARVAKPITATRREMHRYALETGRC